VKWQGDRPYLPIPEKVERKMKLKIGDRLDWNVESMVVKITKHRKNSKVPLEMTGTVEAVQD